MSSLQIVYTGKSEVALVHEPIPEPAAGQVLVESTASLISTGTEVIVLERLFEAGTGWDNWVKYPFTPGYSNVGRVTALGPEVEGIEVGERVAARIPHRQHYVADPRALTRVPDGVSDDEATWFALGKIVQMGIRAAQHKMGDDVVIVGAGALGQLVIQYARLSGARRVIVIDTSSARLKMAVEHGATHSLAMGVQDAPERIAEITQGRRADVVYDVTGYAPVFSHALKLVADFGRLVILGDTGTPSEQRLTHDVIGRGITIVGAHDGHAPETETRKDRWTSNNIQTLFLEYVLRGDMRVKDLITHRYSPLEAVEAYGMLVKDRSSAMGVVFDWTKV